jgi:hypothetical protein
MRTKEQKAAYMRLWRSKNLETWRAKQRNYYYANRKRLAKLAKKYAANRRLRLIAEGVITPRPKTKEEIEKAFIIRKQKACESSFKWRSKNLERVRSYALKRYYINKEKLNKQAAERSLKKYQTDELFRLKVLVRRRINDALFGFSKSSNTETIIGCSILELKSYIESQFTSGMSWECRGLIHIDHVVPLASAKTKKEILLLCHYSNLRPLWAKDNLSKGAKRIAPSDLCAISPAAN